MISGKCFNEDIKYDGVLVYLRIYTQLYLINTELQNSRLRRKQDGPSLESSSYLNVSLRYPGPWDPGTLGPPPSF